VFPSDWFPGWGPMASAAEHPNDAALQHEDGDPIRPEQALLDGVTSIATIASKAFDALRRSFEGSFTKRETDQEANVVPGAPSDSAPPLLVADTTAMDTASSMAQKMPSSSTRTPSDNARGFKKTKADAKRPAAKKASSNRIFSLRSPGTTSTRGARKKESSKQAVISTKHEASKDCNEEEKMLPEASQLGAVPLRDASHPKPPLQILTDASRLQTSVLRPSSNKYRSSSDHGWMFVTRRSSGG
jgi:hypothetical protein